MADEQELLTAQVTGLARSLEGAAIVIEGVRRHLEASNVRPELEPHLAELEEGCREAAADLRR